jgi:hypothetical protein
MRGADVQLRAFLTAAFDGTEWPNSSLGRFTTTKRVLGPTQLPIEEVLGASFSGVKRPGREANNRLYTVLRLRMRGAIPPLPRYIFMAGWLVKHRDNFTVTLHN